MLVSVSGGPYTEDVVPDDTEGFGENANGVKVWLVLDEMVVSLCGEMSIV